MKSPRLINICFVGSWVQFLILLSAITFLSLTPSPGAAFEHVSDKLLHVIGWSSLSISLGMAWLISAYLNSRRSAYQLNKYLIAVCFLFAYSIGIEIVQQYTGRQLSGLDMVANSVGVTLGSMIVWRITRWMDEKHNLHNA